MASETEETTSLEAWEAKLEKEIQDDSRNGVESSVPSILRDLLRSYPQDGQQAAQDAARRINFDYRDKYLPSDPLLKGRDDEGMAGFLYHLYLLSLDTARLIHYSSPEQDALVQLFVELRKLPPEQFKIAGVRISLFSQIFPGKNDIFSLILCNRKIVLSTRTSPSSVSR